MRLAGPLLGLALCTACRASGPIELETHSRGGLGQIEFDENAAIHLDDPDRGLEERTHPPRVQLTTFRLPVGTTVSAFGQTTDPVEGSFASPVFGNEKTEKHEPFEAPQLLHRVFAPEGNWKLQVGGAQPLLKCPYEVTVAVEGRGEATIEHTADCGGHFVRFIDSYLAGGNWLDVKPAEKATGRMRVGVPHEKRGSVKKIAKNSGATLWTLDATAESLPEVRHLVVAREKETGDKKCEGYADTQGHGGNLFVRNTTNEVVIVDLATGKEVAKTSIPSKEASCPKEGRRGDLFFAPADTAAEAAWVDEQIAKDSAG